MGRLAEPILDEVVIVTTDDKKKRERDLLTMLAKAVSRSEKDKGKDKDDE